VSHPEFETPATPVIDEIIEGDDFPEELGGFESSKNIITPDQKVIVDIGRLIGDKIHSLNSSLESVEIFSKSKIGNPEYWNQRKRQVSEEIQKLKGMERMFLGAVRIDIVHHVKPEGM
jgi:hypothetical protein